MFVRPRRVPLWLGPTVAAALGIAIHTIPIDTARAALGDLRDPLLFLVFAVPLAVLLDRIGVFTALAGRMGHGERLLLWLWLLGIGVTVVFNLDAAVVLLTPLYIRIAERHGLPAVVLAFQPALLACLASNPLPVSNLTNLIAAERLDLGVGEFLAHLGPVTVVACTVGWFGYARWARSVRSVARAAPVPADDTAAGARALRRGLPIVGFVLVGFTVGNALGVPAWTVAAVAVAWAIALDRTIPWRTVPAAAMLVAASLAVLVAGALDDLHIDRLLDAGGAAGRLRAVGFGAIASDVTNNLPTVLAGTSSLHERAQVWALLVGTNIAPALVITGSLSALLWRDTARRLGVSVTPAQFTGVGLRVALAALVAAAALAVVW
jgi:arsenical pump membrane protein